MSSVGPTPSFQTIEVSPSAGDTSVDPSAMSFPPRSLEPEFTGDEGLIVYHVLAKDSKDSSKSHRKKILEVKITGSDAESTMIVDATSLSLDQQGSMLDRLISEHEGKKEEEELLEDVRFTILQNRILQKLELAEGLVVNEAYVAGKLEDPVKAYVWAAADKAREKSGLTIGYDPARVRRLIWAILQVVPASEEVLKDLDMDALLLSTQMKADPVESTAPTAAIDAALLKSCIQINRFDMYIL